MPRKELAQQEYYSFSICDSPCQHMVYYYVVATEETHTMFDELCDELKIDVSKIKGVFMLRDELTMWLKAFIGFLVIRTPNSPRLAKVEYYLKHVVEKSDSDEEFYIHVACWRQD